MKGQRIKKLMAAMLAVMMTLSLLTGCSNPGSETGASTQASTEAAGTEAQPGTNASETQAPEDDFEHDPVLNELGADQICKEPVTITIGIRQNANVMDYENNTYTQMLEEYGNVNIDFVIFPSGEAGNEKLRMMIAGQEELPDIIMWSQGTAPVRQWAEEGYVVPLQDYFEHSSYYAAEGYARVLEQSGLDILDFMTQPDGNIWYFPVYYESITNPTYSRCWIYQPWLDAVGMDVPTTTEEFYAVMQAFATKDPNGNGKADEIPLLGSQFTTTTTNDGANAWEYLMNAFTHVTVRRNFMVSNDGEISFSYTSDEWKEGIKYISRLVQEKLYDPVSFTQDAATWKGIMNTEGDQLVGCFVGLSLSNIAATHPSKNGWTLIDPLVGPDGYSSAAYVPDLPSNRAWITTDCEHPEVAFRILDLMCREDLTITSRWGVQGENWDYITDLDEEEMEAYMAEKSGIPVDYDWENATFAGYPALFLEYNTCWNVPTSNHWMNVAVVFRTAEIAGGWYAASMDVSGYSQNAQLAAHIANYEAVKPAEPITQLRYAEIDDETRASELISELNGYVFEKMAAWFTGVSDVEEDWDSYLADLEAIGLSECLELVNGAWN